MTGLNQSESGLDVFSSGFKKTAQEKKKCMQTPRSQSGNEAIARISHLTFV